jgi:hypothetical protein
MNRNEMKWDILVHQSAKNFYTNDSGTTYELKYNSRNFCQNLGLFRLTCAGQHSTIELY